MRNFLKIYKIEYKVIFEATRIVIKYQLCVKTNSCVFNCKPDNKNRNPEDFDFLWLWSKKVHFLCVFMAIKFQLSLVIIFMAFYDCVRTLPSHQNPYPISAELCAVCLT